MAWTQGRSGGGPKATNFAVACSLLSQYIKEKGGVADLGLVTAAQPRDFAKGRSALLKPSPPTTTMSLLPGADVGDGDDDGEKENLRNHMNLFPRFGLSSAGDSAKSPNLREPEKAQLTIFYGGKVLVLDDFPAEKAKDLMHFAGQGTANLQKFGYVTPSSATAIMAECQSDSANQDAKILPAPVNNSVVPQGQPQVSEQQKISDLPIARKASLHRFLEKRKDRISARAPYQATGSSAKPTLKSEESNSYLGSPQVSEHAHS